MTRIKMCGLTALSDIYEANSLAPDYIGFVFAKKSRRYLDPGKAALLKKALKPGIRAVGVFVDEDPLYIRSLAEEKIIDMVQLHGTEDEAYIKRLRELTSAPIIKAFQIKSLKDLSRVETCSADHILLDSGTGSGQTFNWELLSETGRPYFLAGGLTPDNVGRAVSLLHPYGVDVSSGIETGGKKDALKMRRFMKAVQGR
ncbi:MAG: phosphoribosylanthranilate isomerase [Eubacterium sp.]|nr:phosphoribosylanthranilate isomerase [Eubacterium sp.]